MGCSDEHVEFPYDWKQFSNDENRQNISKNIEWKKGNKIAPIYMEVELLENYLTSVGFPFRNNMKKISFMLLFQTTHFIRCILVLLFDFWVHYFGSPWKRNSNSSNVNMCIEKFLIEHNESWKVFHLAKNFFSTLFIPLLNLIPLYNLLVYVVVFAGSYDNQILNYFFSFMNPISKCMFFECR